MTKRYVKGFKEAEQVLNQLPGRMEARVLQAATMSGAREIRKEVKKAAPRGDKTKQSPSSKKYKRLYQNIKAIQLKSLKRKKGIRGSRVTTGNAFWGVFLEFGTKHIAAKPWFRPAVTKARDAATEALKKALGRGIEREASKLARKNGVK